MDRLDELDDAGQAACLKRCAAMIGLVLPSDCSYILVLKDGSGKVHLVTDLTADEAAFGLHRVALQIAGRN